MCRINQCFCCCNLRVGSYTSAIYTMVLGAISLISAAVTVDNLRKAQEQKNHPSLTTTGITAIVVLIFYVLWVLSSIFLIIGVSKRKRGWMIPWMIMTIIVTVLAAIVIIILLVGFQSTFSSAASAVVFIVQVVIFCFNVYALLCVFSYYRDDCQEQPVGTVKGAV